MAIKITWTHASGLNETMQWLDDDDTQRILQWAREAYPTTNQDGTTQPASYPQACRRAGHSWINSMKDATRKWEKDAAVADVPDPPPISVVEP